MKTFKINKATLALALAFVACMPLLARNPEKTETPAATAPAPPTGCNLPISATRDLVADFGAFGNGIFDDSPAFKRASDWINANWSTTSTIKVTVPAGTYLVGKQLRRGETWNYGTGSITNPNSTNAYSYLGIKVFELLQVQNVIIEGAPGLATKIVYKNGLIYGGYRTDTDQPCQARNSACNVPCPNAYNDVATVGTFLYLDRCNCITASNFWVEGRYNMCDRKGNVGECASIQLEYDGVLIAGGSDIELNDITCANFGRDGIMSFYTTNSDVTNLTLNNFVASGNGRNGYSLASGVNVIANNCDFVLNGKSTDGATYGGNPQAGLDIETDQGGVAQNCNFNNCKFTKNGSYGFTTNNYYPSNITLDNCLFSSLNKYALWPSNMINSRIKNSTVIGQVTHVAGANSTDHLILENNLFTDWFGNWQTPVTTIWAQNTLPNGKYLFDLPNADNIYYTFRNNTIDLHHSKLVYTNGNNPASERVWDQNNFMFSSSDLLNSSMGYPDAWDNTLWGNLGQFKNCTLLSNQFIDVTPVSPPNSGGFSIYVKAYTSTPHPATDNITDGLNFFGPTGVPETLIKYNNNWIPTYFVYNTGFW